MYLILDITASAALNLQTLGLDQSSLHQGIQ